MPAYNFKSRFADYVKEGSKEQTVRSFRKHPVRVGDKAYLFWGLRTRQTTILRPAQVISSVMTIYISEDSIAIIDSQWLVPESRAIFRNGLNVICPFTSFLGIPVKWLSSDERDQFAWNDGFRWTDNPDRKDGCFQLMLMFWKDTHDLPFLGQLIKWNE